ncbi:MAG: hypothetical protein WD688_15150 [Candidatus Binatia bacterium]
MTNIRRAIFIAFVFVVFAEVTLSHTFGQESTQFTNRGPMFVSVVYPVLTIDEELVELIDPIPGAYNLWGRDVDSFIQDKSYFPAPLSYPYKFSKKGITNLESRLRHVAEVDRPSIKRKNFPNIPSEYHHRYEPSELKYSLIHEEYLSFKLKNWENIEFKRFPTFLVMVFDYAQNSEVSYERIRSEWNEKVGQLRKLETLLTVLGVSRKGQPWSNVPLLTFVALASYSSADFWNYFFGGNIKPEESRKRFLGEMSLRKFSGEADSSGTLLRHCFGISYEKPLFSAWRLYYAQFPLFYDKMFASRTDVSPLKGSYGSLARILRTALFVNVTLPEVKNWAKRLDEDVKRIIVGIRDERARLTEFSTERLASLESVLKGATSEFEGRTEPLLERVDEAKKGYDQLLEDIQLPFAPPTNRLLRTSMTKHQGKCMEPFEMGEDGGDARRGNQLATQIENYRNTTNSNRRRLNGQIASATILLENGRALLADIDNTGKAIAAGNENTKQAIAAGNQTTKLAIDATLKATDSAIRWGLMGAIGGAILGAVLAVVLQTFIFERRTQSRSNEMIQAAITEQKKQTQVQAEMSERVDNASQELTRLTKHVAEFDDKINRTLKELKEQKSKQDEAHELPVNTKGT